MSEESGIPDMEIYTQNISIDLSNDLMETPEEITLLVNSEIQGNVYNSTENISVNGKFRQWSVDYIKNYENDFDLYPENSNKKIPTISSKSLINISANWQNEQTHKVFGESFFVRDAEKWIYGNSFFKSNKKTTKKNDGSFQIIKGTDPVCMRPYINDFDLIYRNVTLPSVEFPAVLGMSMVHNNPIYYPFAFDNADKVNVTWQFTGEQPPELNGGTWVGNFLMFDNFNPDTTYVNSTKQFLYGVRWVYHNYAQIDNYICSHSENDDGQLELIFYEAHIVAGKVTQLSTDVKFKINLSVDEVLGKTTLNVISNNSLYPMVNDSTVDGSNLPIVFEENSTYNGMPYYEMESCTGGGQYGTTNLDLNPCVDEFLALADMSIIPMNVKVYTDNDNLSIVLDRVKNFFRNNETYIGTETDIIKMNNDSMNWYCMLDVGMASDYLNAYSNWLSSRGKDNVDEDTTDYTIYGSEQNYSIYPSYSPNMMSNLQYDIKIPTTNGYNFRRPLTIYGISSFAKMGCKYTTSQNLIRVYSRFNNTIINNSTGTNHNMNLDFNETAFAKRLHPLITIHKKDSVIYKYCETNDIPLVGITYHGSTDMHYGFIQFKDTCSGNLEDNVTYDNLTLPNYRQCFRIYSACNLGFDPASTTNLYASGVNRDQSTPTNGNFFVREFFGARNQTTTDLETGTYSYGEIANPIFSPRVEDYINFINIGASAPMLLYKNNRMSWSDLYTPRRFNSNDALPGDPNIGPSIAFFNDKTMFFNCLNCTIGSVPDFGVVTDNVPVRGQPGFFQSIKSTGIIDSLSGIGFQNFYTRDELSKNTLPNEDGVFLAKIHEDGSTENYHKSLFWLLGFKLSQFKPQFGFSYNRYSTYTYNRTDSRRDMGINYFALNSLVNQSASQLINIFGPNYLSTDPVPVVSPLYPQSIQAQPEFMLSFVGFQPMNIQVSSDQMRALNITASLQQSFYKIVSNLPSVSYVTSNNNLNCMGYLFRQYKNSSFYFSYGQSTVFTLTEDLLLTSIRTQILSESNRPAEHLGSSAVMFYKIITPSILTSLNKDDIKSYISAEKAIAKGKGGISFISPISETARDENNALISQSNVINIFDSYKTYKTLEIEEMIEDHIPIVDIPTVELLGKNKAEATEPLHAHVKPDGHAVVHAHAEAESKDDKGEAEGHTHASADAVAYE